MMLRKIKVVGSTFVAKIERWQSIPLIKAAVFQDDRRICSWSSSGMW